MNIRSNSLYIGISLVVVIVFGYLLITNSNRTVTNRDSKGTSIVALGDSLVYGVGSSNGNDFLSILSRRVGQPIINLGVSGNTTIEGLARIGTALDKNPKIVILLLGGNDYLKKVPVEQTFTNLQKMVDLVHANGSMVLLLGVRGGIFKDIFGDRFEEFAKKNNVAFVPNVIDGIIGNKELLSDSIHPNDAGYLKIADRVEPVLRELLF